MLLLFFVLSIALTWNGYQFSYPLLLHGMGTRFPIHCVYMERVPVFLSIALTWNGYQFSYPLLLHSKGNNSYENCIKILESN